MKKKFIVLLSVFFVVNTALVAHAQGTIDEMTTDEECIAVDESSDSGAPIEETDIETEVDEEVYEDLADDENEESKDATYEKSDSEKQDQEEQDLDGDEVEDDNEEELDDKEQAHQIKVIYRERKKVRTYLEDGDYIDSTIQVEEENTLDVTGNLDIYEAFDSMMVGDKALSDYEIALPRAEIGDIEIQIDVDVDGNTSVEKHITELEEELEATEEE